MSVEQNVKKFQESVTSELNVIKDRVRDLIGAANWGVEGGYKEAVLRKIISQYLPSCLSVGTGFIVGNDDYLYGSEPKISTQLDIIIYNNQVPVVFREGDFVILTEGAVKGVIEVKTKTTNYSSIDGIGEALNQILRTLGKLSQFNTFKKDNKKFVGIFSYEHSGDIVNRHVNEALIASDGIVNHIVLGPNKFIRYWEKASDVVSGAVDDSRCYVKYDLQNLSFSYFISNLLHAVTDGDLSERNWFSFPIEGTKETHRIGDPIMLNRFN